MSLVDFIIAFRELFPEFDSVSDTLLEIYYNQCQRVFSACDYAMLFLCAHLIAIDKENSLGIQDGSGATIDGGNGENTAEKVGELDITLMTMAEKGRETYFTSTAYGRRYLTFRNACPSYAFSVRTNT